MIPERFHARHRDHQPGQAFGISIGLIASSYIAFDLEGRLRRAPFYVFAIPTVIAGILMWIFIKEPPRKAFDADAGPKPGLSSLFKSRNLVLTFIMVFCSIYGFFVMISEPPGTHRRGARVPATETGFVSSLTAWTSVPAAP